MNSFRSGMQVHAVPDDERAIDANGKPFPWAYSYADAGLSRKQPVERGPFGRPTIRRATSRTKTATPGTKEDPVTVENMQAFDAILGRHKKEQEERESKAPREQRPPVNSSRLPHTQSAMELAQASVAVPTGAQPAAFKEPTAVLAYGYGLNHEGLVISHLEELSMGHIYEDYDRAPLTFRHKAFASDVRASIPRSLPREVVRRINTYQGGSHWIKLTLDSPEAAERLTFATPINVSGYTVYVELWRGAGPSEDVAIPHRSGEAIGPGGFRQRRPLAKEQARSMPSRLHSATAFGSAMTNNNESPDSTETLSSGTIPGAATGTDFQTVQSQPETPNQLTTRTTKPLRIQGATRIALKPASEALLPVAPWPQRTFGHVPLLGSLVGGDPNTKPGQGGGIIGNAVPRKEDGTFDWPAASLYWRLCWFLDTWLGTDLCGMKGDD